MKDVVAVYAILHSRCSPLTLMFVLILRIFRPVGRDIASIQIIINKLMHPHPSLRKHGPAPYAAVLRLSVWVEDIETPPFADSSAHEGRAQAAQEGHTRACASCSLRPARTALEAVSTARAA